MLVHKDNIQVIVAEYLDKSVASKASGWHKIGANAMAFFVGAKASTYLNDPQVVSMLSSLGILDVNGFIDMDFLRDMALDSLSKSGNRTPPVLGYSFDSADIDSLYNIAQRIQGGTPNV